MQSAQYYASLLSDPNVQRGLAVIRASEGTARYNDPYSVSFGGNRFDNSAGHPETTYSFKTKSGKTQKTSAAGAYQFLKGTWNSVSSKLGLASMTPPEQDIAALALIDGRGGLDNLLEGDLTGFVKAVAPEWASLPTAPKEYDQPSRSWQFVKSAWNSAPVSQIATADVPIPAEKPGPDYAAVPVPAQKPAEMQTALVADNPASAPFDALLGSSTALSPTPAAASTLSAPMDIPAAPVEPVDRAPEPMTKTPPSRSMAGVTSDDLASDPLSGALAAEAPTPQSRPALYGNEAGIPTPASRPASDPWSGMRTADDPLAGALAYAEVDPMLTSATQSGFADKLAYAQAQGPSDVNIDPSMMDPAFGAPVDPLASAIKAPVQPLAPPVEVKAPPQVKGVPEAPVAQPEQAMDAPSGLDFFSAQSNYGMDTGGGTLYRDAAGQEYRYNPEFDKTYKAVRSDNGISYVPADPNETLLASVPGLSKVGGLSSRGKKSGEKSNIRNALEGAIKVGAVTANPIAAIAAGTLGWNANRIANNGGVLGKLVGGMFGVNTDPYATAERSARNAALANNGGSFQPSSSNPSDYSYSPAAHDAIASGQSGLF